MNRQNSGRKGESGNRSGGGGGFRRDNFNSSPREMHKTTCSECKKECEVPFKPTQGKPVYCKDCYQKRNKF